MEIKKMPLVDDLAQSIQAVKDHLPVQTAKDLIGIVERSAKLRKLSKIGFAAMGISAVISLIFSGLAHYFAPSAGIAEFDVPRILIESFSSSSQLGSAPITHGVSDLNNALGQFMSGPVMQFLLLGGTAIGIAAAVIRQTLAPLIMVGALAGSTMLVGSFLSDQPIEAAQTRADRSHHDESPQERFKIAIKDQNTATLRAMLTDNSHAATYLKAQMAIKDEKLASSVIGEAAKAIALGDLDFAPNNQVAYAIERSAGVKQFTAAAKAYVDPATAKLELFTSLSQWIGIVTFMFGLPGIAVLMLHVSIQRRIRRIGRLSTLLLG